MFLKSYFPTVFVFLKGYVFILQPLFMKKISIILSEFHNSVKIGISELVFT